MTKTVRIGSGLGFYGDAWEPVAASIERGGARYIASDHGFHGLHNTGELLGIWPTLVGRESVEPRIRIEIIET